MPFWSLILAGQCQKPHWPRSSFSRSTATIFNFFFLGKKEIGLHYTLIMCEFFINIIIHPQQLSKQAQGGYSSQVASEEQREDLERYAILWACPWIMILLGISLGLISTESSTDFRPYRCCPILLGGRAGVRDWVLVLMVMVMFWTILLEFVGHLKSSKPMNQGDFGKQVLKLGDTQP